MVWFGSVQCPDCGSPIDADASVCPYCYSSRPYSAPWQAFPIGEWWWAYAGAFVGLTILVAALASDAWFGTHWIGQMLEAMARSQTP